MPIRSRDTSLLRTLEITPVVSAGPTVAIKTEGTSQSSLQLDRVESSAQHNKSNPQLAWLSVLLEVLLQDS